MINKINFFLFIFNSETEISISNSVYPYLEKKDRQNSTLTNSVYNLFGDMIITNKFMVTDNVNVGTDKIRIGNFNIKNNKSFYYSYGR